MPTMHQCASYVAVVGLLPKHVIHFITRRRDIGTQIPAPCILIHIRLSCLLSQMISGIMISL